MWGMSKTVVRVDMADARAFEARLREFGGSVARKACARALTKTAAIAAEQGKENIRESMVIRNRWTLGSVRSTRATARRIDDQFAMAGSVQPYMAKQERGGELDATGDHGRRLTTGEGSREGRITTPRKKLARGRQRMARIQFASKVRTAGMSKQQATVVQVHAARRKGEKFVWLELPGGDRMGVFRVQGSKRKPKIVMIHRVMRERMAVKARPWLEPAAQHARRQGEATFRQVIADTVRTTGVFRKR